MSSIAEVLHVDSKIGVLLPEEYCFLPESIHLMPHQRNLPNQRLHHAGINMPSDGGVENGLEFTPEQHKPLLDLWLHLVRADTKDPFAYAVYFNAKHSLIATL